MDLWIRGQNKLGIVKVDILNIEKYTNHYDISTYHPILKKVTLGTYKTEKRALEILNDIEFNVLTESLQENNISYELADIKLKNIIANNMIKIYNMPKE